MNKQDITQFHLNTIEDILKLIDICHNSNEEGLPITYVDYFFNSEKLDELKHYTLKLKRFISQVK